MRSLPIFLLTVILYLLCSHFQAPTFALEKSYIVYMGSHTHGPNPTSFDIENAWTSHYQLLGSVCNSTEKAKEKIFYSYTKSINDFAAYLDEGEAAELAKHPNVVSIFLNKRIKLQTTHSWSFLGLEGERSIPKSSLWRKARFGKDVIIANIDTGVWPESKSFSDERMGSIPLKWRCFCQNETKEVHCNRKLIGVRYFNKAALARLARGHVRPDSSFFTSRDMTGHGTHTLSTAAEPGNFVVGANAYGLGNGTAKGGSPDAKVVAYKVCWELVIGKCLAADTLAALDAAIYDGVDVISFSLGGGGEYFSDVAAIGSFHAIQRGIVVVGSAGNDGPAGLLPLCNAAPWTLTVGAATIDRQFTSFVTLGDGKQFRVSLSTNGSAADKFYPLISGEKATNKSAVPRDICSRGTLDSEKVKGKILVCPYWKVERYDLEFEALRTGAIAMILTKDEESENFIEAYNYRLPAAELNFIDSELTFAYINSTKNPIARISISRTYLKTKPAPAVAGFSSRGPNPLDESILKPDIIAPGVNIIAANSLDSVERQGPFAVLSGTSMAAPHVAGVVGLLKSVHPNWSPAAIHSAIRTTAVTLDNSKQPLIDLANNREATPFAHGAGHINPSNAVDPGLVYDLAVDDYLNCLCALGYNQRQIRLISSKSYMCSKSVSLADFNYPSITIPNLNRSITVNRIVKNVGSPSAYTVYIEAPKGVIVSVEPTRLKFTKVGEVKKFQVTLTVDSKKQPQGYVFGKLTWSDGKHQVTSPLVVKS